MRLFSKTCFYCLWKKTSHFSQIEAIKSDKMQFIRFINVPFLIVFILCEMRMTNGKVFQRKKKAHYTEKMLFGDSDFSIDMILWCFLLNLSVTFSVCECFIQMTLVSDKLLSHLYNHCHICRHADKFTENTNKKTKIELQASQTANTLAFVLLTVKVLLEDTRKKSFLCL